VKEIVVKKIIVGFIFSVLLSACGGGGSDSTSLSKMSGTWDASSQEGDFTDVSYVVINIDGTFIEYDYMGDSFHSGPDCYEEIPGTIVDQGNGNYLIDGDFAVQISVSGDTLEMTSGEETGTLTRSTRQESSFNLCSTGGGGGGPNTGLSSIEGVWDYSSTADGLRDEFYTVYRNGEFIDYDFQGDSFDNGPNCYQVHSGTIEHVAGDTFLIDSILQLDMVATGDIITLSSLGDILYEAPRSIFLESDFTPICDF